MPECRCGRKTRHDQTDVVVLVIVGTLAGMNSYRKIHRWAEYNYDRLKKYLRLKGGIPSLSTISRIMWSIDQEMLVDIFISWMSSIIDTRGRHIAIDGK
ncbi:MAG: ISAs1 family transposase [Lachnospiraceae bacterium]|nr:ISAs1 family transposase [Lachnospiraceae bacterium]MDY2759732.1 ISAs1 family transposase [Lachnospiraceae bacterium]